MRARLSLVAVAALAVATTVAACGPSAPSKTAGGGSDATLTIATTTDVVNFNPLIGNSRTDNWITSLMYPRLLTIDANGAKQPYLAKSFGYTNPTTGYYELRDDMTWSDGKPVTAADVAYTINAILKDKPAGNTTYGQLVNVDSASAPSPTRVELKLKAPDSTVVGEAGFWMNVVPQHVFEPAGSVANFANNSNWVSAGPYKLTSFAKGQNYTLERVTPYPFAPNNTPTVAKIVYRVYPDINTEILALKNGDVDLIANALPPAQVKNLQAVSGVKVEQVPGLGYAHMTYNMKRKPLDDLKVRQALAHAVDYNAIRTVVLQGQAVSTGSSPIPPVLKEFVDPSLTEYNFDPNLSKQLLAEAGYGAGRTLSLSMIYSLQDAVTAQWATIVKDDAAKAGITINLQGMDRNTYLAKTAAGEYDIYAGNFAIMDDPTTNMALTYLPGGAINYSLVDDPALNALITRAQASTDRAEQRSLAQQAAKLVHDNVYDNVMYMQNLYFAHSDKWSGFVVKPSELLSVVDPQSLANVTKS
ncbi:peptide/nickel transport system substrate-binding protein [Micromonospora pisi]|uniref:Peptide/nickel transport system substrate-binding protein n=1 Tax=Micromonospora pisi TaxID=589240 RepID=A0A495JDH0_9ACTN|nr:ABC transporter substrate-binding protein [Micromonospora pisi]RKR86109.1 peptide/nickel transport system substrate-binding protein [Micromonospora pisi]